jgi:hypothetical protein
VGIENVTANVDKRIVDEAMSIFKELRDPEWAYDANAAIIELMGIVGTTHPYCQAREDMCQFAMQRAKTYKIILE